MPDAGQDTLALALRGELAPDFADLRAFMDRRIAELSAEVSASVQLASYSEEAMTAQLAQMQQTILGLVDVPSAGTRNSGIELEAVVQATEAAATVILESAEAIQAWIDDGARDGAALSALSARVNTIFEACAFQDVTGQRIRRAIQHLQQLEISLRRLAPAPAGVKVANAVSTVSQPAKAGPDLEQQEIDRLLNG